ncbi:MAG: DUF368 domain-containing protein [Defluviitaleaceae bacterium]|nr:DUF368 domain-containing protein [Defluviitaleaceae bacterium]
MIINAIKGIFIGIALIIPGLSASTFAVVMGLYDKLISSVNELRKQPKKSLKFLLPIGVGVAVGILVSAGPFLHVINYFPLPSYAFFIGLVLGSVPVIFRKMKPGLPQKYNFAFLVLGLAIIVVMSLFTSAGEIGDDAANSIYSLWRAVTIFGAGFISCFLIAVPGVSGSMVLILIGMAAIVYGAVDNLADALIMIVRGQEGAFALGAGAFGILIVFFAGALLGLLLAAKLIGALIQRREASVYFAVMGLVLGAVYALYAIGIHDNILATFDSGGGAIPRDLLLVGASLALGFICTGFMGREKRNT